MKNKFYAGSSTYICVECGKRTRDTGRGEYQFSMCYACMERCERENAENDRASRIKPHDFEEFRKPKPW